MTEVKNWSELIVERSTTTPAVVDRSGRWTTADLLARASGAAEWLDSVGASSGDPVTALVHSSPDALALAIAGALTHRPLAPLGTRLTGDEIVRCIQPRLASSVLVADAPSESIAAAVAARTGQRLAMLPQFSPRGVQLKPGSDPDRVVLLLHTSGTTGLPRAVEVRDGAAGSRADVVKALLGLKPGSLFTSASGFHHVAGAGMYFALLGAGAAVAPMDSFSQEKWQSMGALGVTHALLVPTMIEQLVQAGALAIPGLEVLQYGASPIRQETLVAARTAAAGIAFLQFYGQTEGTPITCLSDEDHRRATGGVPELLGSVGRAVPGTELRIEGADEEGVGELWARGPHLFLSDANGWLHTGDLARVSSDGYVFLSGRKGDKIIRGGENVYPLEVEELLRQHPLVMEVAVVGVPDQRLGEAVRAHVVLRPGATADAEELRAFARQRLAGFKVPSSWVFQADLPRSSLGKLLRRELSAQAPVEPDKERGGQG